MDRARRSVEEIRESLSEVERRIAGHSWVAAVEGGTLPREALGVFAREQRHIIASDMASFAIRSARAERQEDVPFFHASREFEQAALDALAALAAAVPAPEPAPEDEGPLPGAFAYAAYVGWMADRVRDAEYVGAFLVNLPVWGANCARLARSLRSEYGLDDAACAFFDLFAAPAREFEAGALDIIEHGYRTGVSAAAVARCARLLQGYELMYWDTLAGEAGIED